MKFFFKIVGWCVSILFVTVAVVVAVTFSLYWLRDSRNLEFLDGQKCFVSDSLKVVEESVQENNILLRRTYGANKLEQLENGYYVLHASGTPFEIGTAIGKLAPELLYYQEKVFVDRIREMIPSDSYLALLRVVLGVFNRNLASYIPDEYKTEIYSLSMHCTDEFNIIGSPYDRQLNYHAAHDIGHAMQRYILVGCSSFGVWGDKSENGKLLIGRNFDFYMGNDFAKNRLLSIIKPQHGYAYFSIAWPGMIGVLSGMNEKGLTITLNAAQGKMPETSATPVSILARTILQYASNIEEAAEIASKYKIFTSEQFLIGSAADNCCAVIEKSPDTMDIVYGNDNHIISTNHFNGENFESDSRNIENIEKSDSRYRYDRLSELLLAEDRIGVEDAALVLRNRYGLGGKDIGFTNQKSINQMIAHHSVIFEPSTKDIWVAGGDGWQCGKFLHFNLDTLLSGGGYANMYIPEDSLFIKNNLKSVLEYRDMFGKIKKTISGKEIRDYKNGIDIQYFISLNPEYYQTWVTAAKYYVFLKEYGKAKECYDIALTKEIATEWERGEIFDAIANLDCK